MRSWVGAAAIVVAWASAAQGEMCVDMKTIVGAAPDNFSSITDDVTLPGSQSLRGSIVWLEGANECWIDLLTNKLVCYWGGISQNMAESNAKVLATQIARCLGRPVPKVSDSSYDMTKDHTAIRIHAENMDTDVVGVGAVYVTVSRSF